MTPEGSAPVSLSVGVGVPVAVTVNESNAPMSNVEVFARRDGGGLAQYRV